MTGGRRDRATDLVDGSDTGTVLVSRASGRLRRELRPLAWVVLEQIALDAVAREGRLIARTSARRLAEQLGVDPGTTAGALRALRRKGLVVLERESGVAGRFGLAVYVLGRIDGLSVVTPGAAIPHVAEPHMGRPCLAGPALGLSLATSPMAAADKPTGTAAPQRNAGRRDASGSSGQGTLDLGGSA